MAKDIFANNAVTTITSGGTTAPAQGTSESWTATSSASFVDPSGLAPATGVSQMRLQAINPSTGLALDSELMLLTNVSGTTWTVTRGADNTTPVTRATGFTIVAVATAAALESLSGISPDARAVALGYINWNFPTAAVAGVSALTSGERYAASIYLPPGKVVTNICLKISQAGSGTVPTSFFVGLCSATTMLAQSSNLNSSSLLTSIGAKQFPLNATYTTNSTDSPLGLYYALVLEVGAFATTPVNFVRGQVTTAGFEINGGVDFGNIGTSQTVLPTNGAAVTLNTAGLGLWVGVS